MKLTLFLFLITFKSFAFLPRDTVNCALKNNGAVKEYYFLKGNVIGNRPTVLNLIVYGQINDDPIKKSVFVKASSCVGNLYSIRDDLVVVDLIGNPVLDDRAQEVKVEPTEIAKVADSRSGSSKEGVNTQNTTVKEKIQSVTISEETSEEMAKRVTDLFFKEEKK